jgi:hypothetical protein
MCLEALKRVEEEGEGRGDLKKWEGESKYFILLKYFDREKV